MLFRSLGRRTRWHPLEIAFWLATLLPFVLAPDYLQLASQIAIAALFATSLDLILGHAGIVSIGYAAYFGLGAYTSGILSKYGVTEPVFLLVLGALVNDRPSFIAAVPKPLVDRGFNAGNLIREVATVAGGKGGGRPELAQAGATDPTKLDEALQAAAGIVRKQAGG